MKHTYTLFYLLLVFGLTAQNQVILNIDQQAGSAPVKIDEAYTVEAGYDLNFSRLQYYISEITLIHDGGQETFLDGHYILANGLEDESYDLGMRDVTQIEGIRFHIGVDELNNHADPTLWPSGHPLAPQDPTMHWGWAAGYRFAAIEGKAGKGMNFLYQIHALGDQHYGEVSLDVASENVNGDVHIHLVADYLRLFDGLDVSFGLIEHSDAPKAAQLLTNLKENVFTAATSTSTHSVDFDGVFEIQRQFGRNVIIGYDVGLTTQSELQVTSNSGQLIRLSALSGDGTVEQVFDHSGVYHVSLIQNGSIVRTLTVVAK